MATYYRWRRSTVSYAPQNGAGSFFHLPIGPVYPGSENSRTVYYSTEVTANNDNTLTLSGEIKSVVFSNVSTMLSELGVPSGEFYFSTQIENTPNGLVVFCQTDKKSSYQTQSTTGEGITITRWYIYSGMVNNGYLYPVSSVPTAGTSQGYVYSTSSTAYPNGGVSGGYYYGQRTTVSSPVMTAPDYPNPITTQTVTVTWEEGTSNVPSAPIHHYEFLWDNGSGNGSVNVGNVTSYQFNIPAGTTSIQFGIKAVDTNGYGTLAWGSTVVVHISPTLTVPQMVMQGQQATISWTAIEGADSYTLQRKADTDSDWTQVYSGANTSYEDTAGTWTSVQYRVQAVFEGNGGGWATSASIPVVAASALVISGTDGDLGMLTADVQYTISSDGTNPLNVTESINGVTMRSFAAVNGGPNIIPVVDLPTGTGTITITATTSTSSGDVTVTREWTYTKTAPTFAEQGGLAQLTQQGNTIWAKTIAEAVRTPGIWGGNLGLALNTLAKSMLYDPADGTFTDISGGTIPMVSIETGSYVGTGTYGQSNPTTLTTNGTPMVLFVTRRGAPQYATLSPAIFGCQSFTSARVSTTLYAAQCSWGKNSVSYYNSSSADYQLNTSGATFDYLIITLPGGDTE